MKLKLNLRQKMTIFILSTIILIITIVAVFVGSRMNKDIKSLAFDFGNGVVQKYAYQIQAELNKDMGITRAIAHSLYGFEDFEKAHRDSLVEQILLNLIDNNRSLVSVWANFEYNYIDKNYTKDHGRKSTSAFINNSGSPEILRQEKDMNGHNEQSDYYYLKTNPKPAILNPYFDKFNDIDILMTSLAVPIMHGDRFVGLAGTDISLDHFKGLIKDIKVFDRSILTIISSNGTIIAHSNPELIGKKLLTEFPELSDKNVLQNIRLGKNFSFLTKFSGEKWYSTFAPINVYGTDTYWSFEVTIPVVEIIKQARKTFSLSLIVLLFSIGLLIAVIFIIANNITRPLSSATSVLKELSKGNIDISQKVDITSGDEIEEMGQSLNTLMEGLNRTEQFAKEIEQGNLDADYELLGDKDMLGNALLTMRDSLKVARKNEEERKKEEEKQRWTTHGIAMFSDILRNDNDNLEKLSFNIISNIVKYLDAIQGGLFLINDNDKSDQFIEMMACYAYDRRKFNERRIEIGEGLIGRCFIERKTIYITDVPNNYVYITSGLGKENPRAILIVPLIINDQVYGVIELASFKEFEAHKIAFVEKVGESIASTVSTVKINIKTALLLEQTQQQAEEMAAQEEEMRQNMEELQATQEEAARREEELRIEIEQMREKYGE